MQVERHPFVQWPKKMKNPNWDKYQYCSFHKGTGHSIEKLLETER